MSMSKLTIDKYHKKILLSQKSLPKEQSENIFSDHWVNFIKLLFEEYINQGETNARALLFAQSEVMAIRSLHLKKYHNIYINNFSLVEFIENNKIKKNEIFKAYEICKEEIKQFKNYGVVLNLKGKENSILFNFNPVDYVYEKNKYSHKGSCIYYKIFPKGEMSDVGFVPLSEKYGVGYGETKLDTKNKLNDYVLQLFLNLCAYMSAFPECVVQGPPLEKTRSSDKRSTIVKISDSLRDVYRDGVSPHMRRGHFRFLKSDRYTNKRFQAVYVRPTMVKGSATTVVYS